MSYNISKNSKNIKYIGNNPLYTEELVQFSTSSATPITKYTVTTENNSSTQIILEGTCFDSTSGTEASSFHIVSGFYTDGAGTITSLGAANKIEIENVTPNINFTFSLGANTINVQFDNANTDVFLWTVLFKTINNY